MRTFRIFFPVALLILASSCSEENSKPAETTENHGNSSTVPGPASQPVATPEPAKAPIPPPAVEPPATNQPAATPTEPVNTACGDEDRGQPPCPLQGWMETYLAEATENRDTAQMATLLRKLIDAAPDPSWNEGEGSWSTIARNAAEKATAGDYAGAKASCKQCHKQWRARYREEHRPRPLPPALAAQ